MADGEVKLGSSKPMIATRKEMVDEKVPIAYRDQCAHLLIPLNKCRSAELFLPWKCENERHTYEKCEYELVMERMLQMQKIRQREEERLKQQKTLNGGIPLIPSPANA
ncbi:NADH-ubiquinone oxidoreductase B18 subunit family protein, expressed [Zostera marina]|uniref:NADH dehydrogenase [ubiquinone] 1 beta subcomplex subunit 7 n=1 Tax=Zostera marina TaxID=29655 RepID=A0A0K9PN82_ZOSMR|nr:NADH-ubiquinone oxidoreductase B18 subunit family protein, expressed [Zostera marina]